MTRGAYSVVGEGAFEGEVGDEGGVVRGFRVSTPRLVIYYILNVCSLGVVALLCKWNPSWRLKFVASKAPLRSADTLLYSDDSDTEAVLPVDMQALPFLPDTLFPSSSPTSSLKSRHTAISPMLRSFTFRKEKYAWDERKCLFKKVTGLEDVTLSNLSSQEGLTESRRTLLREIYGGNDMEVEVGSWISLLVEEVLNPFYVFQGLSVLLWSLDDYIIYASCVLALSAASIALAAFETRRQSLTLRAMAAASAAPDVPVRLPDGTETTLHSADLVPGDVLLIPPHGFTLPCDAVLLHGNAIVNEAMLTGESVPVHKSPIPPNPPQDEIYDSEVHKRHTLFCGTQVIQTRFYAGNKVAAVVVRTGFNTLKGQLVRSILYPKPLGFKFYSDAYKFVGVLFSLATLGMTYAVYLYVSRGTSWWVTVVRVLDIVTIVVPPALPAAMTVGTVYAQGRLKRASIYCISPPRINFCGKLKLIAFDKTGTLTEDGLDFWCAVPVEKSVDDEEWVFGESCRDPGAELPLDSDLIRALAACHSLTYIGGRLVGDPLDLKMFAGSGWILEEPTTSEDTSKFDLLAPTVVSRDGIQLGLIRQFEFTSALQRMSVIVRPLDPSSAAPPSSMVLYAKGAPEKIRSLCTEGIPNDFDEILDSFTREGYRVLAVAVRIVKDVKWHQVQRLHRDKMECDLRFVGFLVMQNSLKEATRGVIEELRAAEVRCVMVTGDNMLTALSVARESTIIPPSHSVVVVSVGEDKQLEFTLAAVHHSAARATPTRHSNSNSNVVVVDLPEDEEEEEEESRRGELYPLLPSVKSSPSSSISMHPLLSPLCPYHIAMVGATWELLPSLCASDSNTFSAILAKATVYARMSPEAKMELVESLQGLDYIVGMCGDGANDVSALKMAHVGVSLSEAEASVAAPFTSKVADISCVPALMREGRSALVTSFATFKYMALYSMVQFVTVLLLYTEQTNLADMQFLYIDLGITTSVAVFMGRTGPAPILVPRSPPSSLVSFANVAALLLQVVITTGVQVGALALLNSQTWYTPLPQMSSPDGLATLSWPTTTLFSVSSFQYLILAVAFSKGPPFRLPFWTNGWFVGVLMVLTGLTLVLVLTPFPFLASLFELEPIEASSNTFRATLLILPLANLMLALLIETHAFRALLKRLRPCVKSPDSRAAYKRVLKSLDEDPSWPPLAIPKRK